MGMTGCTLFMPPKSFSALFAKALSMGGSESEREGRDTFFYKDHLIQEGRKEDLTAAKFDVFEIGGTGTGGGGGGGRGAITVCTTAAANGAYLRQNGRPRPTDGRAEYFIEETIKANGHCCRRRCNNQQRRRVRRQGRGGGGGGGEGGAD